MIPIQSRIFDPFAVKTKWRKASIYKFLALYHNIIEKTES